MSLIDKLIEVKIAQEEDFLKIKETLTRVGIGVVSKNENRLFQCCHILHKQGKYYIVHFEELFVLDGNKSNFTEQDKARRNTIANLLQEWELVKIVDPEKVKEPRAPMNEIRVVSFKDKVNWSLEAKYNIGNGKNKNNVKMV